MRLLTSLLGATALACALVGAAAAQPITPTGKEMNGVGITPSAALCYGAIGSIPTCVTSATPLPSFAALKSYQLLGVAGGAGASATGASTPVVDGGRVMVLRVTGTFAGATVQLQALDADGVSWTSSDVGALTAAGSLKVNVAPGSVVRALVSGATGTPALWAVLG